MRFAVPQFIDVEDKLFGPLTLKQAIYLAGAGGFAVFIYVMLGFFIAVLLGGPVVLLAVALAFFKINSQPFIAILESAFFYTLGNKLYLWKKAAPKRMLESAQSTATVAKPIVPALSESKLKELAWSLDIKESLGATDQPHQPGLKR